VIRAAATSYTRPSISVSRKGWIKLRRLLRPWILRKENHACEFQRGALCVNFKIVNVILINIKELKICGDFVSLEKPFGMLY
jgi:hypothetical protein